MIEIVDYKAEYAKELSEIILDNIYKVNIKDHGKEVIDRIAKHFTKLRELQVLINIMVIQQTQNILYYQYL